MLCSLKFDLLFFLGGVEGVNCLVVIEFYGRNK